MNSLILIKVIIVLIIKNVTCNDDTHCDLDNNPCYCERYMRVLKCYSNDLLIKNYLNYSLHDKNDLKVTALLYSRFVNLPPSLLLQRYKNLKMLTIKTTKTNKIPQFAFESLNNLQYISVSESNITRIEAKAFHNIMILRWIFLQHNLINEIHANAFYNLPQVEKISLENNQITELHNGTFAELKNLKKLILLGNPLRKLQQNLFGINFVNFLTEESYLTFYIDNTNCFCDLFWLIEFYKNTRSLLSKTNLRHNKCWKVWNRPGNTYSNAEQKCISFTAQPTLTPVTPSTSTLSTSSFVQSSSPRPDLNVNPLINNLEDDNITVNIPFMNNFFIFNIMESAEEDVTTLETND